MVNTAPAFSSAKEAAESVRAGLGFLATANATALSAQTQAECLQILEQAHSMGTAARASILAAFTSGQGVLRGCGLQPAGVADQPHRGHQGRRGRAYCVGPAGGGASRGCRGAGGGGDLGVLRPDDLRLDG